MSIYPIKPITLKHMPTLGTAALFLFSGWLSGTVPPLIALGKITKPPQPDKLSIRESCNDLQFAAHRLHETAQRGQIHIRPPLELGDRGLADMQVRRQLILRHGPRTAQFGQRHVTLHRHRQ